jgi:mRNA interferase HigB
LRIIAKRTIRAFWEKHPDSEQALRSWYKEASTASWRNPNQVKDHFGKASIIGNNKVVFNICENKYRLIVDIDYNKSWIFVRFIGKHSKYNMIDSSKI